MILHDLLFFNRQTLRADFLDDLPVLLNDLLVLRLLARSNVVEDVEQPENAIVQHLSVLLVDLVIVLIVEVLWYLHAFVVSFQVWALLELIFIVVAGCQGALAVFGIAVPDLDMLFNVLENLVEGSHLFLQVGFLVLELGVVMPVVVLHDQSLDI